MTVRDLRQTEVTAAVCRPCAIAVLILLVASWKPAVSAIFTVTNLNDAGAGSLRQAIIDTNNLAGDDMIVFSEGLLGTISLTSGSLLITGNLHIQGPSPLEIDISGNDVHRIFALNSGVNATISDLTLRNGLAPGNSSVKGGCIYSSASFLSVRRCLLLNNRSQATITAIGGAIFFSGGTVALEDCSFVGNVASANTFAAGSAIYSANAALNITNCTFYNNQCTADIYSFGALGGTNSTVHLNHVTCAFNPSAAASPQGITIEGTVTSKASLFAFNAGGSFATLPVSHGHNLCDDNTSGWVNGVNGDIVGADPLLGSLGLNGGPTPTLPLLAGSPCIDGADVLSTVPGDQNGNPRVGCAPDIGAFEFQSVSDADGDGVIDCRDLCPQTAVCAVVDSDGCPADSDGDGLWDGCDLCPGTDDLVDSDTDGIPDCLDPCPNDGDTDGDGVQDCLDGCPGNALKLAPGACGCGETDIDTDADGVADCADPCPADSSKLDPGACGCGEIDQDQDADGVPDCFDRCPDDAAKVDPGDCGCGTPDVDTDANGTADCLEELVDAAPQPTGPHCGGGLPALALSLAASARRRRARRSSASTAGRPRKRSLVFRKLYNSSNPRRIDI